MTGSILADIQARHAADAKARAEFNARQRAAHKAAVEARKAELPHIRTVEPAVVEPVPGERYVLCDVPRVEAWCDDRDCAVVAAVGGTWLREEYARALGLGGEAVTLAWLAAS